MPADVRSELESAATEVLRELPPQALDPQMILKIVQAVISALVTACPSNSAQDLANQARMVERPLLGRRVRQRIWDEVQRQAKTAGGHASTQALYDALIEVVAGAQATRIQAVRQEVLGDEWSGF